MLMVLMALIEVGRSKVGAATRWLWMLLSGSLWLGPSACFPQMLYGPPNDDGQQSELPDAMADTFKPDVQDPDVPAVDVPIVPDVPMDCPAVAYYGPQPCETDAECRQREGPGWYCDTDNVFTDGCGGTISWPLCRPGDVATVDAVTPDVVADTPKDCEPVVAYGPPPCTDDSGCTQYGPEWYCDKDHPVTDPCSGAQWFVCNLRSEPADVPTPDGSVDALPADAPVDAPKDCPPMGWYGPPPCTTDEECVGWYGAGYVCNKEATQPDGCDGTMTYPTCEQKTP